MRRNNAIYIAATGQHVGKTTTCLGLMYGFSSKLKQRFPRLGFQKPVGQSTVPVGNIRVDKDVVFFQEQFKLSLPYEHMSPVIVPASFTRDYLDGKVSHDDLKKRVLNSFEIISKESDFIVVEGTGHTGVGSIFDLNNAQVAKLLGVGVILISPGGLGSSFDELALNREMLRVNGVNLLGVILNKVQPDKIDMIATYYKKALTKWNVPLLGCIPYSEILSRPSMKSLQKLFGAECIAGKDYIGRYFESIRLAVASLDEQQKLTSNPNELIVTHASRLDVIMTMVASHALAFFRKGTPLNGGLIATGPPSKKLNETTCAMLDAEQIPTLFVQTSSKGSFGIMDKIINFTAKLDSTDNERLKVAMEHVSAHVDFDRIIEIVTNS